MGRISSGTGLISGINSKDIIEQLITLESRPKTLLQTRIDSADEQKLAYTDLSTRLTGIKLTGQTLKKVSSFQAAKTTSSDESVLTATASNGAAVGAFQFQVARLVTSQQTVSRGFVDFDSTKVGAGTITIEQGGGDLTHETLLSELNGGAGVRRGTFRITDRSGGSATIDVSASVSVDDVVKKINTALGVQMKATVSGDKLVLTDLTGKTTNNLIVAEVGEGSAAADLGLLGDVAATTIEGTDVNYLSRATNLSQVNDGRGVRAASTGNDFTVTLGDGTNFGVSILGKKTLGEVIDTINTAGGTKIKAEALPGSNGLKITDLSGGGGAFTVAAVGDSKAALDLGIQATGSGGVIAGSDVLAGIDTVLLSSLNGGSGVAVGTISIKSRAAGAAVNVDLSTAKSVADVLKTINGTPSIGVKATLNDSGNGIKIVDTSTGTGNLTIADVTGTGAASLGIVGDFDLNTSAVKGANLQRAWVSENSLLSQLNGGKGVTRGKFKITTASGVAATIDLSQGNEVRLSDVIQEINVREIGVTASINATGDGLLLTDTTTGANKLKVEEDGSTTAADLNIKGSATTTTIDGSYEKAITVTATDTLQDIQKKINDLNFGVSAQIINDGSGGAPYRLSITSSNSGRAGRIVFDAGATVLDTHNLVEAQDAAVFLGSAGSTQPLLVAAGKNQLAGVIKGVNIELNGVSDKPVTLSVTRDADNVTTELQKFTDGFNELVDRMDELTKFDTDTNERGLLLGESTVQTVQTTIYAMINGVVTTAGKYRVLSDVGLKLGDGGKLEFDADKFNTAYADDPTAVQKLFSTLDAGVSGGTLLNTLRNGSGIRHAESGTDFNVITRDGSAVAVSVADAINVNDVIRSINTAGAAKFEAKLGDNGNLVLTDLTTGTGNFNVAPFGASQAATDLGLTRAAANGIITGERLTPPEATGSNAGIGLKIESAITRLIDPVSGVITRNNKSLEERTASFKDRIGSLDKLLAAKRLRLEKQFANMESVLSNLQGQQTAIGQIQTIRMPTTK